jgi:hypothetical protein
MEVTSEILSQNCTYLAVYIKLDPTHARHSNTSARHAIISMLMGVLNYKEEEDRELHSPNTLFTMVHGHAFRFISGHPHREDTHYPPHGDALDRAVSESLPLEY